ncbi:ArnT family glycosyltransferase [Photobacterium lutimaris]|uniref:Phospholipid carrier-dependent glycosyltransferase n=1 Tax=Photobacterium lutimaris TaxID=388278 RepID=A0A2T3J402_9GAMM|nr:glycosyltransferase family 39 protein [Photobacterium lutimaris]PSU35973.1 phospholipid carrier-dependent glycosyltransferase [Photobacterium lutimaris]TDR79060.1 dolichyl-phosphate-mannose-protein mannosyltransferase [Photobacterium lutimaris]
MSKRQLSKLTLTQFAMLLTVGTVLVRLATLGFYPLMDTTEARYGEMARIMFETGNWVTPMFDYNVPFWGKPPLFTWLSAGGFELMGVNEFAARVPHLVVGVLVLALTWLLAAKIRQKHEAWLATAILSTTTAFIVISGAVMTDTALTLAVTLSMVSFWLSWEKGSKLWGYLFFVGLAIGMLAKGPLTMVLVGISLVMWLAQEQRWRRIPSCLPWKGGSIVFLIISLPWYLLAEWKSPGFLNYFIIGEHIKRFVVSGWQGDLYGSAHDEVRGTIWLFWFLAALPWAPILMYQVSRFFRTGEEGVQSTNGYMDYLWCWMLSPMLLFTMAGNILPSYVMPGLPALGLLVAGYHSQQKLSDNVFKVGLVTPVLLIITAFLLGYNLTGKESEKVLLSQWAEQAEKDNSELIYIKKRPFSAQFYSEGKAKLYQDPLTGLFSEPTEDTFFVLEKGQLPSDFLWDKSRCELRAESNKRQLVHCKAS